MWANEEVVDLCRWLRAHNDRRDEPAQVGFHGLDGYSLWDSLREMLVHLREHDPDQVSAGAAGIPVLRTPRRGPAPIRSGMPGMLGQLPGVFRSTIEATPHLLGGQPRAGPSEPRRQHRVQLTEHTPSHVHHIRTGIV